MPRWLDELFDRLRRPPSRRSAEVSGADAGPSFLYSDSSSHAIGSHDGGDPSAASSYDGFDGGDSGGAGAGGDFGAGDSGGGDGGGGDGGGGGGGGD